MEASLSVHSRPVFTLDEPQSPLHSFAQWSGFEGVPIAVDAPTASSPDSTPRLGAAWHPCSPPESYSAAEIALAVFEASRSRRKRSVTLESTSTSSSFSSLESSSGGEYDNYLTPATSVASISPCHSPIELESCGGEWVDHAEVAEEEVELERSASVTSMASSLSASTARASIDTFVAPTLLDPSFSVSAEPLTRSASHATPLPALMARPLLARCLTAPDLGHSMVRSISRPVATQAAHDEALRALHMNATEQPGHAAKRSLDDAMGEMRLETFSPANLPWPYNRIVKQSPDSPHRAASTARRGSRPALSRAVTFDTAMLAAP